MTPWTVVLAAGAGRRLASVTGGVPKQFWRAAGGRSLLRQTLDRFAPLAPTSRTVVVVDAAHRRHFAASDVADRAPDFILQPTDRGTATGVLLAMMPVLSRDPDGVVVITPSDHGIADERRFRQSILDTVSEARERDAIVLFGVEPSAALADYGWITLGRSDTPGRLRPVASFVEKPERETAARLFATGAVWNTMVTVARARSIWNLYAARLPELTSLFSLALRLAPEERRRLLADAYPGIAPRDFSRDVLTGAPGLSAYVWPSTLGWSDLGTPERLSAWQQGAGLAQAGRTHAA